MITLRVNGRRHELRDVDPDMPLLWALRDHLGLTGTKYGCGMSQCGACTVHVDGRATRSCGYPVGAVGESEVTTIEGLAGAGEALRHAWIEHAVSQCGYCQPGQLMSAAALLAGADRPDDDAIDRAMSGNICRCGTYQRIRAAIHAAARAEGGR